jgi:hypothetical protein
MKKLSWSLIIFAFFVQSLSAQADFRPGFIIKNNGDTLKGLVFYGIDGKFDRACKFKRFEIAREFTYGASALKAFGFRNGRYFESKNSGKRKVFFECLLKGEISVFIKPGKSGDAIYLESPGTGFFRLSKGISRIQGAGTFSSYAETLQYLLNQTGRTKVNTTSTRYNSQAIVSLVREAGSSSQEPYRAFLITPGVSYLLDYSVTRAMPLIKMGISGGYQFLTVNVTGTNSSDYFREADYNSTYRPVTGFYISRKISKKKDLASIEIGLNYLEDVYYGYGEKSDGVVSDRNDIRFEFSGLQVPLSLKLTFGKNKIHPYLRAGVYKTFLLTRSYLRNTEHQFQNEIHTNSYSDFSLKGDLGFQGGAGLEFSLGNVRSFGVEALYMKGGQLLVNKTSLSQVTTMETSGFSVMLHLSF